MDSGKYIKLCKACWENMKDVRCILGNMEEVQCMLRNMKDLQVMILRCMTKSDKMSNEQETKHDVVVST